MTASDIAKTNPSLQTAVKALRENIKEHVTTEDDPASHNLNVALLAVALSLLRMERELDQLRQKVDHVSSRVSSLRG